MKKFFALFVVLLLSLSFTKAQESTPNPWKMGGQGGITYNQVGLVNWAAGGNSNMTLIGNLNLFANRAKANSSWENSLDLAYGFLKNYRNNAIFTPANGFITKAEDKIDLVSKYGRKAWSEKFQYAALFNFKTQFAPGFATPGDTRYISRFLSPGYLILAVGLDYKPFKSGDVDGPLSVFFSPLSGKVTMVSDDSLSGASAFGVNQVDAVGDFLPGNGLKTRVEFGATLRVSYKQDFVEKKLGIVSTLQAFSNYIDRPGNVDWNWDNALVAKLNKFITVNFFTSLIYDHDIKIGIVDSEGLPSYSIDPHPTREFYVDANGNPIQRKGARVQFKEVFGVGFSYKFDIQKKE